MRWTTGSLAFAMTMGATAIGAAPLVPHEAVYELTLASQTDQLVAVDARIAMQLKQESCDLYDLDYRFVARFSQESEMILTDQRTLATESIAGDRFDFETKTFVDGDEQKTVSGTAANTVEETEVTMTAPVARNFSLPLARFPLQHTARLIEDGRAGRRIVETRLFDGDENAEKDLTTTAVILPEPDDAAGRPELAGLRSWRIDESYFNDESDVDGMPIFRTRYTLYENGVTDALYLDFGDYALEGRLSRLEFYEPPNSCAPATGQ